MHRAWLLLVPLASYSQAMCKDVDSRHSPELLVWSLRTTTGKTKQQLLVHVPNIACLASSLVRQRNGLLGRSVVILGVKVRQLVLAASVFLDHTPMFWTDMRGFPMVDMWVCKQHHETFCCKGGQEEWRTCTHGAHTRPTKWPKWSSSVNFHNFENLQKISNMYQWNANWSIKKRC